jgi:MFS transporter, FHS family, L-fucose permease
MAGFQGPATCESNYADNSQSNNYTFALTALTSLFFMWGFITCLNDILIPHLKNVFSLSYTQAMLIQFCFFGAYFVVSPAAGVLAKRVGYKKGIVTGLLIASAGCLLFYPAASILSYPLFLGALFVLASGIAVLQVSANPYVTALGSAQTASSRLNLTQAFNALGTTVAPFFGTLLILSAVTAGMDQAASTHGEADAVKLPYLLLASAFIVLAAIFSQLKLPEVSAHKAPQINTQAPAGSAWSHRHLVLGAVGIFVYVGAEVSIGSLLVNFLGLENIAGLEESQAGHYIAYYWGGAMVGRFIGAAVMRRIDPGMVLSFNATAAIILVSIAIFSSGSLAMWAILLVGLCNSIMFPTIFSLGLNKLGHLTSQGSGILCQAIVGGGVLSLLQGYLADQVGIQLAFIMPVVCYIYIAYYGLFGSKVQIDKSSSQTTV